MERKQNERTRNDVHQKELEKVNGGIIRVDPEDEHEEDDHENGGGATGGW